MLVMIGAFLGLSGTLLTVFAGSLIGAVAGLFYIFAARKEFTYELPFGTFLGGAALLVGLFGEPVLNWYWSLSG